MPLTNKPLLVIVIPSFNEEEKIERALKVIIQKIRFELGAFNVKLAVVNDGSTDKTKELLSKFKIEVLNLPKNMGKAYASMYGIKHYSKLKPSAIMLADADVWSVKGQVMKKMTTEAIKHKIPTMVQAVQREDNQGKTFMRDFSGFRCFNTAAVEKLGKINLHHFRRERKNRAPGFGLEEFFRRYMQLLPKKTVINLTQKDGFFRTSSPWRANRENYQMQHQEIPAASRKMKRILRRVMRNKISKAKTLIATRRNIP